MHLDLTPPPARDPNDLAREAGLYVVHDTAGRVFVAGMELRYLLTTLLVEARGPMTVEALVSAVRAERLAIRGRPAKAVSDALRWEVRRGRVVRVGRGLYGPGTMPRQTRSRIRIRVDRIRTHIAMTTRMAA